MDFGVCFFVNSEWFLSANWLSRGGSEMKKNKFYDMLGTRLCSDKKSKLMPLEKVRHENNTDFH